LPFAGKGLANSRLTRGTGKTFWIFGEVASTVCCHFPNDGFSLLLHSGPKLSIPKDENMSIQFRCFFVLSCRLGPFGVICTISFPCFPTLFDLNPKVSATAVVLFQIITVVATYFRV
jgi:hypothetical protein